MNKNKILFLQFLLGIILALSGAFLMFFGVGPLTIKIIFGIIGIIFISNSQKLIKIRKV